MIRTNGSTRRPTLAALLGALLATSCLTGVAPAPAHASTLRWVAASGTVGNGTSCANPNYVGATHASIQAAIDASDPGDEVMICSGEYAVGSTITVNEDITLSGSGSTLPVLDGGNANRIMSIGTPAVDSTPAVRPTVSISHLWFRSGRITGDGNFGAGISVQPGSTLMVEDSNFTNNRGDSEGKGGAISLVGDIQDGPDAGSLTVRRSTFKDNYGYDGGAILVSGRALDTDAKIVAVIENSTFVKNTAYRSAGAIGGSGATVTATNSTFIDSTTTDTFGGETVWWVKMVGNLIAYSQENLPRSNACGYRDGEETNLVFRNSNLIDNVSTHESCVRADDPATGGQNEAESTTTPASLDLGFLAPWGTNVSTMSIGPSSTAIDAVDQANCLGSDQRGESRSGATCDAGAFEYVSNPSSITATPSTVALFKNRPVAATFAATNFTPQSFRVAVEVSEPLPQGVNLNAATGEISGTASTSFLSQHVVVTARDASGATTSVRLVVDNCVANPDGAGKYIVASADDLESFRLGACGLDADFVQDRNIEWNDAWSMQVTATSPFNGSYDGGGHSITGLQISGREAAFIPRATDAAIENLSLDVAVSGEYGSAALVRYAINTTIDNVHASGTVAPAPSPDGHGCIGGLLGESETTSVSNSSFDGTVGNAVSSWIGGIAGCAYAGTVIENSSFDGDVVGLDDVGGLVGWISGTTIRRSFATGTVTAARVDAGGLVGYDDGSLALENSYFSGSVQGAQKVGGLVGSSKNSVVSNSYASASITGTSSVGGLIGEIDNTTVSSSFWEADLAGASGLDPIGSIVGGGQQPAITATPSGSMKTHAFFDTEGWSIRDGWIAPANSQHAWGICSGSTRPFLSWQHSTDACAPPGNDSDAPTNNESTPPPGSGSSAPASSAGATPTTTSPLAPVAEPATKSSAAADPKPKVAIGKFVTMVGATPVKSSVKWRNGTTIKGMIGVVNVAVVMNPGSVTYDMPGTLAPGSSFALTLRGLKSGSDVIVNIHSTTRRLGKFTASSAGVVNTEVDIPVDMVSGSHRVEVQAVDKNGEMVSIWMGVKVRSVDTLPSTGTPSTWPVMFALLLLCLGSLLVAVRRPMVVGYRSKPE